VRNGKACRVARSVPVQVKIETKILYPLLEKTNVEVLYLVIRQLRRRCLDNYFETMTSHAVAEEKRFALIVSHPAYCTVHPLLLLEEMKVGFGFFEIRTRADEGMFCQQFSVYLPTLTKNNYCI
jgi:hypothetical protein